MSNYKPTLRFCGITLLILFFALLLKVESLSHKDTAAKQTRISAISTMEIDFIEVSKYPLEGSDVMFAPKNTTLLKFLRVTNVEAINSFKDAFSKIRERRWNHDSAESAFRLKVASKTNITEFDGVVIRTSTNDVWIKFRGNEGASIPNLHQWFKKVVGDQQHSKASN
jgi:hypothetical protein